MNYGLYQQFIFMQFPIVILIIIFCFQLSNTFNNKTFKYIALGWLMNLLYLFISHLQDVAFFDIDFSSQTQINIYADIFELASHFFIVFYILKFNYFKGIYFLKKIPNWTYITTFLSIYSWTIYSRLYIEDELFINYFITIVPSVLIAMFSLTILSGFFKNIDIQIKKKEFIPLSLVTLLYAIIQILYVFDHKTFENSIINFSAIGFGLGFLCKGFILYGLHRIFVVNTEWDVKNKHRERILEQLLHEISTPIIKIDLDVSSLYEISPRREGIKYKVSEIQNSIQIVKAVINASKMMSFEDDMWQSKNINRIEVVSANTLIQFAKIIVKQTKSEEKNVNFYITMSKYCNIRCVPNEIIQALLNIFKNSYDSFTNDIINNIIIVTSREKIDSEKSIKDEMVNIIITDNGIGIDKKNLDKIYEDGWTTKSQKYSKRGFGLALTKRFIKNNNGKIEINSPVFDQKKGIIYERPGTVVKLRFPRIIN